MKNSQRLIALLGLICSSLALFAQSSRHNLSISHLTGNFYVYTTYKILNGNLFPSNSMYVVTNKGVILIDTPWDTTQFQPLLDSIAERHQQKVIMCISTHYHDDRTAGIDFLKSQGVKTYSSKQTYDLCKEHQEKQSEFYFTKDTTFTVGNYSFQTFYPGEGHSKDNIVIWFDQQKILYGGCLVKSVENNSLGNIADANISAWPETIKNVIKHFPNPNYVIPGHFDWTNNQNLKHTLTLLEKKENK